MAKSCITNEQVEQEILQLQNSPYVKLAQQERRLRERRRMYLYGLRQLEKKGRAMSEAGITPEILRAMYQNDDCEGACDEC